MNEQMDRLIGIVGILVVLGGIGVGIYILVKKIRKLKEEVKEGFKKTKEGIKKMASELKPVNLNVDVELLQDSISIKNKENFELKMLEVKLNTHFAAAFKYIITSLKPNEEIKVQLREFIDKKGYRLDMQKVKIYNLRIDYDNEAKGWLIFNKEF